MAGSTRLELATSGVTGRRSNQLNYNPAKSVYDISYTPVKICQEESYKMGNFFNTFCSCRRPPVGMLPAGG